MARTATSAVDSNGGYVAPDRCPPGDVAMPCDSGCPAVAIARAFAQLHRQTHGGPVASCTRQPCASLMLTDAAREAGPTTFERRF
jgi:hypothetical protein